MCILGKILYIQFYISAVLATISSGADAAVSSGDLVWGRGVGGERS